MAETDSGTRYPATEYFLRGVAQDVTHTSGKVVVTREAIVSIENITFRDKGDTRKVSTATVAFLTNVEVKFTDTVSLPGGQPLKVLKVTAEYAPYWPPRGFTTTVLLA